MKVQLLLLEGVEKEMQEDLMNQLNQKEQLSQLQDMYHKRLTEKGYDLERGIKGSDNQHIKIKEYKKVCMQ